MDTDDYGVRVCLLDSFRDCDKSTILVDNGWRSLITEISVKKTYIHTYIVISSDTMDL